MNILEIFILEMNILEMNNHVIEHGSWDLRTFKKYNIRSLGVSSKVKKKGCCLCLWIGKTEAAS